MKNDLEFWTVEDTGFSHGLSWFKNPRRFETPGDAMRFLERMKTASHPETLWRIAHTRVKWKGSTKVTLETFTDPI